jgi:hypothetical protein
MIFFCQNLKCNFYAMWECERCGCKTCNKHFASKMPLLCEWCARGEREDWEDKRANGREKVEEMEAENG